MYESKEQYVRTVCESPASIVSCFEVESDAALLPPVDLTGNLIEKLVFGGTWTVDLPISSPDWLTSAPARQGK